MDSAEREHFHHHRVWGSTGREINGKYKGQEKVPKEKEDRKSIRRRQNVRLEI